MIQIKETEPFRAAQEIAQVMQERGGEWYVNAIEDEGYLMALFGSPDGGRMERSGSPSLSGPFSARWSLPMIAADLRESKEASQFAPTERKQIAIQAMNNRAGRNERRKMVRLALSQSPRTASELAQLLCIDVETSRNTLRKMASVGIVRRARKKSNRGIVYELAA